MAYIVKNPDDQQEQKPAGSASPFTVLQGPTTAAPSPFAPLAPARTPNARQGSGNFFNVQRLINANKGAGSQLASTMVAQADRATQNAQNQLSGVVDKFNNAAQINVNGSSSPVTPELIDKIKTPGTYQNLYGKPDQYPALTPDLANQYRSVAYAGPRSLADVDSYQGAQNALQQAQQQANALTSYGGRQAMLDGGAGYGRGSKAFDVLLASNAGRQVFDQANARAEALNRLFADASSNAQNRAGQVDSQVQSFHNAADEIDAQNKQAADNQAKAQADEADRRSKYDAGAAKARDHITYEQFLAMSPHGQEMYQQYGVYQPYDNYDSAGNPLPNYDANGNPIQYANGQPVNAPQQGASTVNSLRLPGVGFRMG